MPNVVVAAAGVLCIGVVLLLRRFQLTARLRLRRRLAPNRTPIKPASALAPVLPAAIDSSSAVAREPEPLACAFPVHGLPPDSTSAGALETSLRRISGVTAAYVSPVTALAYLAYLPEQVSEEQLAEVISGRGYGVGESRHRFDWQHRARIANDGKLAGALH